MMIVIAISDAKVDQFDESLGTVVLGAVEVRSIMTVCVL
jgi:hypothetical protein